MIAVIAAMGICVCCVPRVCAQEAVAVSSSAASAVLYEPSSGRVLFEQNAHVRRPMASTTKLMTALLAAESVPQEAMLTSSFEALNVEGSSMGLQVGDTISRDDLLYGLLLSSGNDAANVFALSMDGSYEVFAERMNARAAKIGMTDTCFVTPSGLDADGHGASAYDMALLAAEVLKNDLLATICATKDASITAGGRTLYLSNHNRLLSEYEGAVGMKTGYTSKAGRCLVSAATRDGVTLIAVTLDCANDWEEHKALLDAGFSRMTAVTLTPEIPSHIAVLGGTSDCVPLCADSHTVTLMQGDEEQLQTVLRLPPYIWAPLAAGDTVGTVSYYLRGACVAELPVTAGETILTAPTSPWYTRFQQVFCQLLQKALT